MRLLDEAVSLVEGDRQRDYDSPAVNFERIITVWNVVLAKKLNAPLTIRDFMWMMVAMKMARDVGTPKRDNLVDSVGYVHAFDLAEEDLDDIPF